VTRRRKAACHAKRFHVVAASACESARLSAEFEARRCFPNGLANSSGVVGRNLMRHGRQQLDWRIFRSSWSMMPAHNHDGVGGMHMYLPWWKFDQQE
jgi:hypothetical protein